MFLGCINFRIVVTFEGNFIQRLNADVVLHGKCELRLNSMYSRVEFHIHHEWDGNNNTRLWLCYFCIVVFELFSFAWDEPPQLYACACLSIPRVHDIKVTDDK